MLQHIKSQQDWEEKSLGAKGFTLIELLVVIVILGILAAVVVFAVSGITDHGKVAACKAEAATVRTAAEAYDAQFSTFPTGIGALYSSTNTGNFLDSNPTTGTNPLIDPSSSFSATAEPSLVWGAGCKTPYLSTSDAAQLPATP